MVRTKYAPTRKRKKKRILKAAKGYYGAKSRLYRTAKSARIFRSISTLAFFSPLMNLL